jgi:hypothetical protein
MSLDKPLKLDFNTPSEPSAKKQLDFNEHPKPAPAQVIDWQVDSALKQAVQNWIVGNWQALTKLDNAELPEQTQKAPLALLAATGYQFLNQADDEQRCVKLAQKWGLNKAQIKDVLMTGVYLRIARANVLTEDYATAVDYFKKSLITEVFEAASINTSENLKKRIKKQLSDIVDEDEINNVLEAI